MKRKYIKIPLSILLALVIAVILLWQFMPYKGPAALRIKSVIENAGIKVKALTVDSLSDDQAIIKDVKLGDDPTLDIKYIAANYSLKSLVRGQIGSVVIKDVQVNFYRKDDRLQIAGLEDILNKALDAEDDNDGTEPLYFNAAQMREILSDKLTVDNLNIASQDDKIKFNVPLNVSCNTAKEIMFELGGNGISADIKPYSLNTGVLAVAGKLVGNEWKGTISLDNILIGGLPEAIPALNLKGDLSFSKKDAVINIAASDKSNIYKVDALLELPQDGSGSGMVTIRKIQFPWGGGRIYSSDIKLPVAFDKPIALSINIENVDLEQVLGKISDGKINGNGKISGTLPLVYYPDGMITLQEGKAGAVDNGTISVEPSLIPGDNEQLDIARKTLQNFNYTSLKIAVSSDKEERSVIALTLEGTNVEELGERPVKLNVNLTGDIIPLLQQSILPLNDLKQLLNLKDSK